MIGQGLFQHYCILFQPNWRAASQEGLFQGYALKILPNRVFRLITYKFKFFSDNNCADAKKAVSWSDWGDLQDDMSLQCPHLSSGTIFMGACYT